MRQQINLYQPIFSETRTPLSSGIAALTLGVVIAGLAGYSFYASAKLAASQRTVATLRTEQTEQEARAIANGEALAELEKPAVVDARNKKLERMIAERRVAFDVLQSGAAGQTSGFAARMEALARRHVEGLWIDKLVLSGTNGSMNLSGATLDADTVPAYLHSLAQDSVLRGTRFDEFVIERPQKSAEAAVATDEDKPAKETAPTRAPIRFRAGSKALTPSDEIPEAAT